MTKPRLALHGGLFSGKTTLADALRERGFKYISYTDMLKTLAVEALQAVGLDVTLEQIKSDKEKFRPFLIELGHLIDFDNGWGLEELGGLVAMVDEPVVLDNVRFPAQMDILAKYGFRLVRITTPWATRIARADATGMSEDEFIRRAADDSETPLPEWDGEIQVSVDGPMDKVLEDLFAQLEQRGIAA